MTAIKESSGDVKFMMKLKGELERRRLDTRIMLGWEELLYTELSLGADGCMVSSAGIVPEFMVAIHKYFKKGERDRALLLQKDVVDIAEAVKSLGFPHGYKLGVLSRGFDFSLFRGKPFEDEENKIKEGMAEIKKAD